MKTDPRTGSMDSKTTQAIFERLRDQVVRRSDEDRHSQRRAVDALRSRIRHLEPPVSAHDTWDQVRPRVERTEEYRALDTDDLRRQAFDRVLRKLKDSREDDDRDSHRGKRDRERRGGSGRPDSRRDRHRTRSPEVDAYAADRKKAQADRERQYHRGSFGVSPPLSDGSRRERRERDSRDDRYEPPPRGTDRYDGRTSRYDRERESRDKERPDREREYVSRADPRDQAGSTLDYGDDTGPLSAGGMSTGSRRRRDTDSVEPGRDPKVCHASNFSHMLMNTAPTRIRLA
jgi:pre-mRNA-processing factor 40